MYIYSNSINILDVSEKLGELFEVKLIDVDSSLINKCGL